MDLFKQTKMEINSLLGENPSPEQIKLVAKIEQDLDKCSSDFDVLTENNKTLRNRYIEAIKHTNIKFSEDEGEPAPSQKEVTLADLVKDKIKERK